MRPAHFNSALRLALGLASLSVLLGGCVYRMPIQQGNYIDGSAVRQLKVGMTRSQVLYLLGTPMIKDPFDVDRWDFVYFYKHGYFSRPYESRVTVFFKNGKVSRFTLDHVPKGQPLIPGLPSS